jgi:hypothetical protein
MKRGWTWLIAALLVAAWALLCVVPAVRVVVDIAGTALDLPRNDHARHYLDQVQAREGYRYIGWGSQGSCQCNLSYYYAGPADVNPDQIFTGPDLTLTPVLPDPDPDVWQSLRIGHGESNQSGPCHVGISRYALHDLEGRDDWRLSEGQRDDFTAGELEILELHVDCEYDHR